MIRANDLDGRAVIDLETAKKVGYVDEIFLDPTQGQIAAFRVSEGSSLTGGRKIVVPASAVESIGPEAIMIRTSPEMSASEGHLDDFPRLSKVTGRKVVSEGGRLLGAIDDVLIDSADGRVHGYTLKDASWTAGLSDLFSPDHDHRDDYIRGDTDLRLSEDLLVVPESSVVHGDTRTDDDAVVDRTTRTGERSAVDDRSWRRAHTTRVSDASVTDTRVTASPTTSTRLEETRAPASSTFTSGTDRWDDVRPDFRSRWEKRTGGRGIWEEHEPSYRYGWEMSNRPEYRGRAWAESEPELRRDWESRHHDKPWDRALDAIRDAWDGDSERHTTDVGGYHSTVHNDDGSLSAIERLSGRPTDDTTPLTESERVVANDTTVTGPDSRRPLL